MGRACAGMAHCRAPFGCRCSCGTEHLPPPHLQQLFQVAAQGAHPDVVPLAAAQPVCMRGKTHDTTRHVIGTAVVKTQEAVVAVVPRSLKHPSSNQCQPLYPYAPLCLLARQLGLQLGDVGGLAVGQPLAEDVVGGKHAVGAGAHTARRHRPASAQDVTEAHPAHPYAIQYTVNWHEDVWYTLCYGTMRSCWPLLLRRKHTTNAAPAPQPRPLT